MRKGAGGGWREAGGGRREKRRWEARVQRWREQGEIKKYFTTVCNILQYKSEKEEERGGKRDLKVREAGVEDT